MTDQHFNRFTERYATGNIPWDSGITPPEIVKIVSELPPGKALDSGCGTGTNVRYLLEHGWFVDGIDFVPQAIERAREKLADYTPERYQLFCYDVTKLDALNELRAPYDLVIDIGCGHNLDVPGDYMEAIAKRLKPGGIFMLYAHFPHEDRHGGLTDADVSRLASPYFDLTWQALSDDTASGLPSGWYQLSRKA